MIIKTGQLLEITGVTRRTITEWVKRGMPKISHGTFDLEKSLRWWRENVIDEGGATVADSKRKYWAAKAEREQIAARLESGTVIDAKAIEKEAYAAGQAVRDAFESIGVRLAPILAAERDSFECQKIIDNEVFQILTNLSSYFKEGFTHG